MMAREEWSTMVVKLGKIAKAAKKYDHVLIVMRHAKAEPFGPTGDIDRELTEKGRKQAKIVGKGLAEMKLIPDHIVCSSATRTRQTLDRMLKVFGDKPIVDYRQSLYAGGMQSVIDELAHVKGKTGIFMIVAHEPTVSICSQWIAAEDSDPALLDMVNLGFSPATVAIFGSNKPFKEWQLHDGTLLGMISVKDFA